MTAVLGTVNVADGGTASGAGVNASEGVNNGQNVHLCPWVETAFEEVTAFEEETAFGEGNISQTEVIVAEGEGIDVSLVWELMRAMAE